MNNVGKPHTGRIRCRGSASEPLGQYPLFCREENCRCVERHFRDAFPPDRVLHYDIKNATPEAWWDGLVHYAP